MTQQQKNTKVMNILLWTAQVILASGFAWAAFTKLFTPPAELAAMWPWTAEHVQLVKLTGVIDLLAAMGLILPALLRILPGLTIYAAWGTIALMVAASAFHIYRGEGSQIGINLFFAVAALFIAWGRAKKVPIAPKGT